MLVTATNFDFFFGIFRQFKDRQPRFCFDFLQKITVETPGGANVLVASLLMIVQQDENEETV